LTHTVSIYRKLNAGTRPGGQRAGNWACWKADGRFPLYQAMTAGPARGGLVPGREVRRMNQTVRFQEILRKLAIIDEGFVEDEAGLGLGLPASRLDPKTAALVRVGALVAIGAPGVCLEWSTTWALAQGATDDEITGVLLAIAPVAGLSRVTAAAPDVAAALSYDVEAALLNPDDL
jgi:4-carboxymuconolactone decarboxylase